MNNVEAGRPARTYSQQLCEDTGCCPEDLPGAMNDWEKWRERVRDIRATSATWWWCLELHRNIWNHLTVCKQTGVCSFNNYYLQTIPLQIVYISSSSSCHAIIPDPLSPPFPIVHCFRQVFRDTSRIGTELLYVCSSWSSCLCSSMWRHPQEYITYDLVPTSPAVSRISGSSNFDRFRDGL